MWNVMKVKFSQHLYPHDFYNENNIKICPCKLLVYLCINRKIVLAYVQYKRRISLLVPRLSVSG